MKQMTLPYPIFILFISLACMTCGEGTSAQQSPLPITELPLSEENIYNYFRVKKAREIASETHKAVSKKKLKAGISLVNMGKQQEGIDTLLRSILYYPTMEAYFQMGNIRLELEQHEDAISAYKMAKFIDNKPNKYLFYNMACAYAMDDSDLDGKRRGINYLGMATRNGYDKKDSLLTDKRLKNVRYTYEFNKIYLETFGKDDDRVGEMFELFVSLFPKRSFPIQIEPRDLDKRFSKKRRLYDPLNLLIGREEYIPDEEHYIAVAMLKKTANFVAVMYLAYPVNLRGRAYRNYEISTYTHEGETIDKIIFADNSNPDKYLCGKIDRDLNITLSTHLNIWEKDPDQYGYTDNKIDYSEFMYEEKFKINEKGEITR